ncbi:MAG: hypothetical protein QOE29_234, partial [Gaiellaceae bacterium]|nr:hypothetical protein [Gaiellaceae bacterium]
MQPWEAAVPGTPPTFCIPWTAIWPGPALELLQHVGASAQCERERPPDLVRPELDILL